MIMKFTVVGAGYVGLSLALLISQKHKVKLLDIDQKKIDKINKGISPLKDKKIEDYLRNNELQLEATTSQHDAYNKADYIIIATPTNYNVTSGNFDTRSVETVIEDIFKISSSAFIIIKSTLPVGFTEKINKRYTNKEIVFSPEFLREGSALKDNLYPERIIIGSNNQKARNFMKVLIDCSKKDASTVKAIYMTSKEAESVKLFANTYLAMRVSYFNELDSFAEVNELSSSKIIEGVSSDLRIGNYYNNPSFGYGGYCLPKDTKQLLRNFDKVPNNIIKAVIESNETRKNFIVDRIILKKPSSVGIYKLTMKKNSDNFRESAVLDIINKLHKRNIKIYIYEPYLSKTLNGFKKIIDIEEFKQKSDIIIANRIDDQIKSVNSKVYTRDIYHQD